MTMPFDFDPYRGMLHNSFVQITAKDIEPIPPNSNPYLYDHWRMGSSLLRGWEVMHEGYDNSAEPKPLSHLILINTRSGQRIHLQLSLAPTDPHVPETPWPFDDPFYVDKTHEYFNR